jgi:FAD/FMN-containing dehydrogenase
MGAGPLTRTPPRAAGSYHLAVADLIQQVRDLPAGAPIRLGKKTSNLFRTRARSDTPRLDVSAFNGVLGVDVAHRTAEVLGMTTYEELCDATLPHGLMPLVVPQLKTITLGGAVAGLGIESTSFRSGMPHESVLEVDILTGAGRVLTVRPGEELFEAFPNSYGCLGYALRLVISLEQVQPFVHLTHEPFENYADLTARLVQMCGQADVDFVDGTAFSPSELYLTIGRWSAVSEQAPSDYTLLDIYYRSIQQRRTDVLTARDYLWRWDTDWFWCSRAFGAQRRWVRRVLGRRWLRSDTYWKILGLEERWHLKARWDARRGLPTQEAIVQDVEVPVEHLGQFLAFLDEHTGIRPVWICPIRPAKRWPLYDLDPGRLWVNVGFWSAAPLPPGATDGFHNRAIEAEVTRLGGKKSLYSTAFYDKKEFDRLYNGEHLRSVKATHDPENRLLDLYDKVVRRH